jgi:hypothetical protein
LFCGYDDGQFVDRGDFCARGWQAADSASSSSSEVCETGFRKKSQANWIGPFLARYADNEKIESMSAQQMVENIERAPC